MGGDVTVSGDDAEGGDDAKVSDVAEDGDVEIEGKSRSTSWAPPSTIIIMVSVDVKQH